MSCEAAKYLGTGFATVQSIVDLAFIQVLLAGLPAFKYVKLELLTM